MPVWSLTMVATKVTSRLLPGRTKASTECWGSEFLLKNIRQFQLWFPFHKETYFWFWILLLPVLHKSVSLQHWQHQTSLNSCPLVPRCPKFSCGGLSSCLLSFPPFQLLSYNLILPTTCTAPTHHMAHISHNTEKEMRPWVIFTVWQSWQLSIKWNESDFKENKQMPAKKVHSHCGLWRGPPSLFLSASSLVLTWFLFLNTGSFPSNDIIHGVLGQVCSCSIAFTQSW